MMLGARAHVLRSRGLDWREISERLGQSAGQIRAACGEWRRKKQARARAKRDAEIFRLVVQNVERGEIAKRYGITTRQVRAIADAVSHRISNPETSRSDQP